MQIDLYGLRDNPFQMTPDARLFYASSVHARAYAHLTYGLAQREGFVIITGEVGAGKTTLVERLCAELDPAGFAIARIMTTQVSGDDLLRLVADAFGAPSEGDKASVLRGIIARLRQAERRYLLIVDEAQALHTNALEELRMLSNFQAGGHALLQIFLLGQPEFRDRLHGSARLEQLRQRVIATHHLDPMGPDEVAAYLQHRLSVVGWKGRPDFTDEAIVALYAGSDGVPRRLNQLAGRVMLHGAIEQLEVIDGSDVVAVVDDMNRETPGEGAHPVDAARADAPIAAGAPPAPPHQPPASTAFAQAQPGVDLARVIDHVASLDQQVAMFSQRLAGMDDRTAQLGQQVESLAARIEEQEVALRRILTLLIDWIESDSNRPDLASYRGLAG